MVKKVVILGAGGLASEIVALMKSSPAHKLVGAVVDHKPDIDSCLGVPVTEFDRMDGDFFFIPGVSDPLLKRKFVQKALAKGWKPLTYIESSAVISPFATIGQGIFIGPLVVIGADANVADYVTINARCGFGHHVSIGSYSSLLGGNTLNGGTSIGEDVVLGSNCVIYPKVKIGNGSVVGIGSVVVRNVKEHTTVFGFPAKKIM